MKIYIPIYMYENILGAYEELGDALTRYEDYVDDMSEDDWTFDEHNERYLKYYKRSGLGIILEVELQ